MLSPLVHLQLLGSQRMLELEELIAALQHMDQSAHHSVLRWFDSCAEMLAATGCSSYKRPLQQAANVVRHGLTRVMSS